MSRLTNQLLTFLSVSFWLICPVSSQERQKYIEQCADVAALQFSNPSNFAGYESCKKCHEQQVEKLLTTTHFTSGESLHRTPKAKSYAKALGMRSIKRSARCVRCHYTPEPYKTGTKAQSGISCESCHGASKTWVKLKT